MGTQAEALAQQVERANAEVIAMVEALSGDAPGAVCAGEGWSVCLTATHIALGHTVIIGFLEAVRAGEPLPHMDRAMIEAQNVEMAAQYAAVTPAQAVALLRANGDRLAALVRSLSDEQVDAPVAVPLLDGRLLPPRDLVARIALGHLGGHFASIQSALMASATA
jgi:hypothetical protein